MIDPGMISRELRDYFRELSPRDRRIRFEQIEDLDEDVSSFCRKLYHDRYTDPKDPDHIVDNWLWKIVYLPGLYSKRGLLRKAAGTEAARTLEDLHLTDTSSYSDIEKTILYLEFRNAAKRYLSTCSSDRYGSRMMGLKKASEEEKKKKAAEDIWRASRGIAISSGEEDRLEIWCAALKDELYQYDSNCREYYEIIENDRSR